MSENKSAKYGVVAVGNALVDVIANVEDSFIAEQKGMEKGAMTLIDEQRAIELYGQLKNPVQTSGGSAANTMAGFASFGGQGAYMAKVANDDVGAIFENDIRSIGVVYNTDPLRGGAHTGRCVILVTPDADRTMNTFLGASTELDASDIDSAMIADGQITYLEGYLFDKEKAKKAFVRAAKAAHDAGRKVALTLSDPFCVGRHRKDFLDLVENHVDILFANEDEIISLYQSNSFENAKKLAAKHVDIAALTRSEKGAVIAHKGEFIDIKAERVDDVLDTTGAGDQFAAGFLYGYTEGMTMEQCGKLGALAAAEVISHIGPRPQTPLSRFKDKV